MPSLINVSGTSFNENLPLRNQPPVVNAVIGAMEIQEFLDNSEWVEQSGSPVAYARYLRTRPLDGVPAKSVIVQFAKGDESLPNPTTTAILRAGDLADRATYFRWDLFLEANPPPPGVGTMISNPHLFLFPPPAPTFFPPPPVFPQAYTDKSLAAQAQIASFFASDGSVVIDPDGPSPFFETPIVPPLPEDLPFFFP